jgi:iron-sulfur cluster assembly accessory protein
MKESGAVGLPLRIAIKRQPDGALYYQMGFDKRSYEGDLQLQAQGVQVVLDSNSVPLAQGMMLDFVESNKQMEFIFINPNDARYESAIAPAVAARW